MDVYKMYYDESYVYFKTKQYLIDNGWTPLSGEPAGGSDELPRVEIRDPSHKKKGSKGSLKIDLISQKEGKILLTEAKVRFNESDLEKLNQITTIKMNLLISAIKERLHIDISSKKIIKSVALHDYETHQIPNDYVCFKVGKEVDVINSYLLLEN